MKRAKSEEAIQMDLKSEFNEEMAKSACCDALVAQKQAAASPKKQDQIATADIAAAPGTYDQSYVDGLKDLVNELKAKVNALNT